MSFTYTNSPATSDRDAIRALVNDTAETGHRLSDETIAWLLGVESSVLYAAAAGAEIISASFADDSKQDRIQVGDLSITAGDESGARSRDYRLLAEVLRERANKKVGAFSGGISISDKDSQESDSDWNRMEFPIGWSDNENSNSTDGRWRF